MSDSQSAQFARPKKPLPRNVKVLGAASLLNDIASEMIFPLMPAFFLDVLRGSLKQLGLLEGVADSIASLLKLWSGGQSDQPGRRWRFVVFGYSLAALCRPIAGIATLPWHLMAIRIADRFGKGIRTAPRDAVIADSTDRSNRGRAFGFHRSMDHLGAAIGPVLAAVFLAIWPDQLRTLFLLAVVPGLLVVALVVLGLRETQVSTQAKNPAHLSLRPFDRNFRLFLVALAIFTLGNSSDAFLLVRAKQLGVPTWLLPLLWCLFHVVKSAGNLWVGRLIDRAGPRWPLFFGWSIYGAIYLGFALATNAWQVTGCFVTYALYYAFSEPAERTLVTRLAQSGQRGLAYGWYHFTIGVVTFPASLLFGWLYDAHGASIAFGSGSALAVLATTVFLFVRDADEQALPVISTDSHTTRHLH
jgi:MFS family permease